MAGFMVAFAKVLNLEYSNDRNALHWNEGELGYTFMGIYQDAHPTWKGWKAVEYAVDKYDDIKDASEDLYKDTHVRSLVEEFYYDEFWDKMNLNLVHAQKIAEEILVFGVNAGTRVAVKAAQSVVGAKEDGILGPNTAKALNTYDVDRFDKEYDLKEQEHYTAITAKRPTFKRYLKGWFNRSVAV